MGGGSPGPYGAVEQFVATPSRGGAADGLSKEPATLWLGSLPPEATEDDLIATFSPYGQLVSATLNSKLSPAGSLSGFVRYATPQEAQMALASVNSGAVYIGNAPVSAQWAKANSKPSPGLWPPQEQGYPTQHYGYGGGQEQRYGGGKGHGKNGGGDYGGAQLSDELTSLWVGSLPVGISEADLATCFQPCGTLVSAIVNRKPSPNGSISGFVRFHTRQEAEGALHLLESGMVRCGDVPMCGQWAKGNSKPSPSLWPPGAASQVTVVPPPHYAEAIWQPASRVATSKVGPPPRQIPAPIRPANAPKPGSAPKPAGEGIRTLFVGGLPDNATAETVIEVFREQILADVLAKVIRDGCAFAKFKTREEAQAALDIANSVGLVYQDTNWVCQWAKWDMKADF